MDLMEIGCEDQGWVKVAQDFVQWQALDFATTALSSYNMHVYLDNYLL
jgi:hypothetical protein